MQGACATGLAIASIGVVIGFLFGFVIASAGQPLTTSVPVDKRAAELAMSRPIANAAVVLRGATAQFQFQTKTGSGDAALALDLRLSPMLNPTTSFVHMRLDGVPFASMSLQHIVEVSRLDVGHLSKGLHTIELAFALQIDGLDPCSPAYREAAWVVIDSRSALHAAADDHRQMLSDLYDAWFVRGGPVRIAMTDAGARPRETPEWLLGFWQADTALRLRHFSTSLDLSQAGASADVLIGLKSNAEQVIGPAIDVAIEHDHLQMTANCADALIIAGQILSSPEVLDACEQWPCRVGPLNRSAADLPLPADDADITLGGDAVVARVADIAASGVRVEGPGTHVVSMRWQGAGSQRVAAGSVLRGRWRASTQVSERRRIVVDIRVNGVAIETFVVRPGLSDVEVSIPAALLQISHAVVDVVVSISESNQRSANPLHCTDDDAPLWLWIDPMTNLVVPRKIREVGGLAGFGRRLQHRPTIQLPSQSLTWVQAQAVAPVLAAFATKQPTEPWQVVQTPAESQSVIEITSPVAHSDLVSAYIGTSVDAPYKTADQTLVHLASLQRIVIYPAVTVTSPVDNLQINDIATPTLMSSRNVWVPLGQTQFEAVQDKTMVDNVPATAVVSGQRVAARRRFQWWLAGAAALVFSALAMTFSRQRSRQHGATK
jgi:hypothetical protein